MKTVSTDCVSATVLCVFHILTDLILIAQCALSPSKPTKHSNLGTIIISVLQVRRQIKKSLNDMQLPSDEMGFKSGTLALRGLIFSLNITESLKGK